jgi:hypothetical protein
MITTIPAYLPVDPYDRGSSLGISFEDYRCLARTALSMPRDTMGIYKLGSETCALDIYHGNRCLTIQVNSRLGHLCLLLSADLDSTDDPLCILSVGNSEDDWKRLGQIARKQIGHA